ncbi:MAG: sigma factor-like helix-turn-helix DNA-binding protein, partial [Bacillota bacterium]
DQISSSLIYLQLKAVNIPAAGVEKERVRVMKVPKHIQKYIEGELVNFSANKKALAYAKQNVYMKQNADGYVTLTRGKNVSRPVEQKVVVLMSDQNIVCLEQSVRAIEDVLNELPEKYRQLIDLRYFKAHSTEWVASELNICLRNFFKWRDKVITRFAVRFGFM